MSRGVALAIAFACGQVALSYEILWYRVYAIALMARPHAFGVVLGGYLLGIGCGALVGARLCASATGHARLRRSLVWMLVGAATGGFLLVPVFARFVTISHNWGMAMLLLGVAALPQGAVFPIVTHLAVRGDRRIGTGTAYVYLANITGAASGAVLTGFYLMDHLGLAALTTLLGMIGLALAALVLTGRDEGDGPARSWWLAAATVLLAGAAMLASGRPLFAGVHERLFFRERYAASSSFVEVVENRSGVIGVTADGSVYGSGVYDGVYNVDPGRFGLGQIHHAYGIGAFHPAPRRVLMIGLGAGSWGTIVANHPSVEQVVIVEINPGYVQLLSRHAAVAGLATHPKAEFAIADGRRWLQRHSGEQFDLVIAHTVYDWRANASSLLSVEFMQLIGRHLAPGGLYYFFSTSDPRVQKTAAVVFPHAWRVADMMVVGDAPIHMDFDRLRRQMADFRIDGRRVLDLSIDEDGATLTRMLDFLETDLESREAILARTSALLPVTDDNMGTEWRLPKRYRLF